jgi:MFS family permease
MSDMPRPAASREGRTIFALTFVVLVYALMQTILVPALPLLGEDLHVGIGLSGWILTAYLLAGAVLTPIVGSFGDRYGHQRVLIVVLSAFLVATVAAAFAPDIGVLIAARAAQGISAAAFPLALAIVRRHLSGAAMSRGIGWIAGILGLGAGAALVIGGVILKLTSWQGIFVVVAVLIAVSLVFVVLWVPQSARSEQAPATDYVGAVLLTTMLVSGLLVITQGASWGWASTQSIVLIAVAVVSLVVLVIVERGMRNPLVDVRSLGRPSLAIAHVLAMANGFVSYLLYLGIPAILEADPATGYGHGFDVLTAGLVSLPSAIFVFIGGRAAPALVRIIGARLSLMAAMALMGIGSLVLAVWPSPLWSIMISFSIVSLGIGGGFSLLSQVIVRVAPADEVAAAGGLNSMMRSVGQATGSPVATAVLSAGVTSAVIPIGNYQHAFTVAAISALVAAALGIGLKMSSDQAAG